MSCSGAQTCTACVRSRARLERHHVGGAGNLPDMTAPACVPCHHKLDERLRAGGVILERAAPRSEADIAWAGIRGLSDLIRLQLEAGHPDEPLAAALERLSLAAGRLLAPAAGGDSRFGPDPIGNARRQAKGSQRGGRNRALSTGRAPGANFVAASAPLAHVLAEAWAGFLGEPLPLSAPAGDWARLAERVEHHPRAEELRAAVRDVGQLLPAVADALLVIERPHDPRDAERARLPAAGVRFARQAERLLTLLSDLLALTDDTEALARIDKYLDGRERARG